MKRTITFLLVLLSAAAVAAPAFAGSVHGTVRDAATLAPLAGVDVTVHVIDPDSLALPTTSGPDGSYQITGIPTGDQIYVLVAWTSGYANYYLRLQDAGAVDQQIDILLDVEEPPPPPGEPPDSSGVQGQVVTPSGAPIPGAAVTLTSGGQQTVAFTDAQGRYQMRVPIATYSVTVEASGFSPLADSNVPVGAGGLTYNAILSGPADVPPPPRRGLELRGAEPNPFVASTMFRYSLARPGYVTLRVYDLLGREVRTLLAEWRPAGAGAARFDAADLPAGTYFGLLRTDGGIATKAVTLLR